MSPSVKWGHAASLAWVSTSAHGEHVVKFSTLGMSLMDATSLLLREIGLFLELPFAVTSHDAGDIFESGPGAVVL